LTAPAGVSFRGPFSNKEVPTQARAPDNETLSFAWLLGVPIVLSRISLLASGMDNHANACRTLYKNVGQARRDYIQLVAMQWLLTKDRTHTCLFAPSRSSLNGPRGLIAWPGFHSHPAEKLLIVTVLYHVVCNLPMPLMQIYLPLAPTCCTQYEPHDV